MPKLVEIHGKPSLFSGREEDRRMEGGEVRERAWEERMEEKLRLGRK